ncbi:docking protein 3 isoform 2 [Homo sapiens]|uniref:Isoform 3 of Docking protein 3 n=2 Tax=Homo sapiens TaxID=9606 RepID=Q7L591-3|nr:docking protein 3 isoform 2 [Homo sapiens]NP_001362727.1 docking protein 3 isoform 2 [Homo sapiens]NP_001362728.1 docking protein 3 isoform 2 [Homo sapiens]XP_047273728.1 docking protein 3 isoform X2 [Homo sapiens]XP_047273729.1 docking protein 3 isoform X2 [Homo sapiens]XP_047273730.1 docking protein 3 isoform X2 [Homo sapiens]|eukprot:NP_001138347.1 docking protein 3 isoform 2 [Homo sapiens]
MDPLETPIKDGILYQQHVKFGKKCWRKVWALLYAGGPSGVARLESWEVRDGGLGAAGDRSAGPGRRGERRVIRLADCVSVLPADGESCPRDTGAFLLTTTERSHLLAAQHRQAWMGPICQLAFPGTGEASSGSTDAQSPKRGLVPMEENSIYSSWQEVGEFPVVVQRTEAATRCQLKGPALLVLGPDAIQLREAKGTQALYSWPYHFLRKFGSDKILLGTPGVSLLICKGERTDDVSGIILDESLLRAYSVPGAGGHSRVQDSLGPVLREPTFQGERSFLKTSMLRSLLCSCSWRHPRSQPRTQASCLQGSDCPAPHRNSTSAAHTLGTS